MFFNIFLELGIVLVVLLAVLLTLFFLRARERKELEQKKKQKPLFDLPSLMEKIESKQTTKEELKKYLNLVLKNYGEISDFSPYEEILFVIVVHPHTDKDIILNFDKELSNRNPQYKQRISDAVTNALKLR